MFVSAAENICSSKGVHWMKKSGLKFLTGMSVASIALAVEILKEMLH